ncbi:Protein Skeletor, isoforms B/C [Portunus trituberculatus]|uniref:Protein Skeletor, isoforms B/C n=1 Tax=Portunus trituberculatus TaxID=210409 RepID=A0A5B7DWI4_PORTR|nr:Protein Skeletor, isoforms B/C [Portunus trituberculatus]
MMCEVLVGVGVRDLFVDFGRTPEWNCPVPEEAPQSKPQSGPSKPPPAPETNNAWYIPPIPCNEPEDGHVGWGIAWYINGLLIPEIHVVRGKTYTFVVEGGNNPDRPERDHPFYITDDPEGGYAFKTPAERERIRVFAGVEQDREGNPVPTGLGRLCEWVEDPNQPAGAFNSFGAYQRTLQLNCEEGQPGVLQWTPDANTPDTVYYQCFTHRYLGWKIRVLDRCEFEELAAAGSDTNPVVVPSPATSGSASLQVQQHFHTPPPRRDPPLPWTTHSPPSTSLSDTFAQNFGFDPESVVYESDFQPVKKHPPGPVLAFEVSPSSSRPLNGPLPPHPPRFHHQVPQGPRTATNLGFTNRQVKIDGAEESDEEVEVKAPAGGAPNPIYHHTVAFSESHAPLPLPIPMAPVLPLLGGAASNMPLKPARSSKTPRHRPRTRPRPRPRPQHRPNMGLAGPIGSVSRLGRPQPPPRRLVASLIPLPEDHAVLAPQLVGPSVLQPVFPAPPPPPGRMGDLLPAASSPIYTSDGRPLPPDSIPGPPQLSTPPHQTSDSITGRPQVGPYRGEPPPPVPANVPHLAQFSKQSRPTSQRTAVPMPPLLGTTSQPAEYSPAGSAPRPVVIAAPKDKLTGTFGVTSSVPSPAPSPGTKKTHLTILKDVWAILTQDHPRDDAHPAHAHHHQHHHHQPHLYTNQHLDGFEGEPRRRRDEGD